MPRDLIEGELRPGFHALWKLARLLRHPEEWPKDFTWDFHITGGQNGYRCGCAIALHHRCFGGDIPGVSGVSGVIGWLTGMSYCDFCDIFTRGSGDANDIITPDVVAGRIEDWVAERPIRYLVAGDRG